MYEGAAPTVAEIHQMGLQHKDYPLSPEFDNSLGANELCCAVAGGYKSRE